MSKSSSAQQLILPEFHSDSVAALQRDVAGFEELARILRELTGINLPLNDKNLSLMASRTAPLLRKYRITRYDEYVALLNDSSAEVVSEFVCHLTTNTTSFFREDSHFDLLKNILPQIAKQKLAKKQSELRIWCSASSTGQEAYSIAITATESLASSGIGVKILATDIDQEVLAKAEKGVYSKDEIDSLPPQYRAKYFDQVTPSPKTFQAKAVIRKNIYFAEFNLSADAYVFQHKFDVIFCRNVLIYFDRPAAIAVVGRLTNALSPGGYLFLGHSESGTVRNPLLKTIANAAYQRDGKP